MEKFIKVKQLSIFWLFIALLLAPLSILTAQEQETQTNLERAQELYTLIKVEVDNLQRVAERFLSAPDEDKEVLRLDGYKSLDNLSNYQPELTDLIIEGRETGKAFNDIAKKFESLLAKKLLLFGETIDWHLDQIEYLRRQRKSVASGELDVLENKIFDQQKRVNDFISSLIADLKTADSLNFKTKKTWDSVDNELQERADVLVGRLQLAVVQREELKLKIITLKKVHAIEEKLSKAQMQLNATKRRITGLAESLTYTVSLLKERGYETASYNQLVIKATGKVSENILDLKVIVGLLKEGYEDLSAWMKVNAPSIGVRFLIILSMVILFRFGLRFLWWSLCVIGVFKFPRLMSDLLGRLLRPFATIMGLFAGLWLIGANPATLLTGVGIAGVIIGLALQDSLANIAAGFFILTTRPYDVDDIISAGDVLGTVKAMGLANTTIITFDRRRLMVPNRKIWGEVIENRSVEPIRRVELKVKVSYEDDLEQVMTSLMDLLKEQEQVLSDPKPDIFVLEMADSWIELAVRPWVKSENWWPMLTQLPRLIYLRFQEKGIKIPYPKTELQMPPEGLPSQKKATFAASK